MVQYPLRAVLIGFFVAQVGLMTIVLSYLALQHGQVAVNTVADNLLSEIVHRVEERLQTLVRDGRLIAASAEAPPFVESAEGPQRLRATAYPNPSISRVSTNLEQQFETLGQIRHLQKLQFGHGREVEHVRIAPFSDPFGLDWLLVVVVPEADFMGSIYAGTYRTMFIGFGILCLTIGFGVIYSGHISKPMRRLSDLVQHVQALKLDNNFDVRSRVTEVNALAQALSRMQTGLASFQRFAPVHLVQQALELGEETQLGGEMRPDSKSSTRTTTRPCSSLRKSTPPCPIACGQRLKVGVTFSCGDESKASVFTACHRNSPPFRSPAIEGHPVWRLTPSPV